MLHKGSKHYFLSPWFLLSETMLINIVEWNQKWRFACGQRRTICLEKKKAKPYIILGSIYYIICFSSVAELSHIIWKVFLRANPSYLYYYTFCHFYSDKVPNITSQMCTSGAVSLMELIGWHNSKGNHRLSCGLPLGCFCMCVCWCVCTYYIIVQWCNAAPSTSWRLSVALSVPLPESRESLHIGQRDLQGEIWDLFDLNSIIWLD